MILEKDRLERLLFRNYEVGSIVLPQGCTQRIMGLIGKGSVEVFCKTQEGEETVFGVLTKGDTFGTYSLFYDVPRPTGIRVRDRARIALLNSRDFIRYSHHNPTMTFNVLTAASRRINNINRDLCKGGRVSPIEW